MTDSKKHGWAFWATVGLVVVLVGYPLSFGPACWLVSWEILPDWGIGAIYRPLYYHFAEQEAAFARTKHFHPIFKHLIRYGTLFDRKPTYWSYGGSRYVYMVTVADTWAARYARTVPWKERARFPVEDRNWNIPTTAETHGVPFRSSRIP